MSAAFRAPAPPRHDPAYVVVPAPADEDRREGSAGGAFRPLAPPAWGAAGIDR